MNWLTIIFAMLLGWAFFGRSSSTGNTITSGGCEPYDCNPDHEEDCDDFLTDVAVAIANMIFVMTSMCEI